MTKARTMRLLYCTEVLFPSIGGVETFSHALFPRLAARGYTIEVLTNDLGGGLPEREEIDGAVLHRLPLRSAVESRNPVQLLETMGRVKALKQSFAPDAIHLNLNGPLALYHLRTLAASAAPTVVHLHGAMHEGGALLDDMFARAAWTVVNSHAIRADLLGRMPGLAPVSSVVHCGVEVPGEPAPLPEGPPHLVFAGRLVSDKGLDTALAALPAILERFPGATLTVAGDGPERPALEAQAADLGMGGSVRFLGQVAPDRIHALLASATLVVMPSRWVEPFGLVAVEAALQARPVLASAIGGLHEAVEDGVTGRLVPREDPAALAAAAVAMLSDPAVLAGMGRRGRERAERLFSIDAAADALDALYRRLAVG